MMQQRRRNEDDNKDDATKKTQRRRRNEDDAMKTMQRRWSDEGDATGTKLWRRSNEDNPDCILHGHTTCKDYIQPMRCGSRDTKQTQTMWTQKIHKIVNSMCNVSREKGARGNWFDICTTLRRPSVLNMWKQIVRQLTVKISRPC